MRRRFAVWATRRGVRLLAALLRLGPLDLLAEACSVEQLCVDARAWGDR